MNIYQLLLYHNAQAIQDLDDFNVQEYGCHIERSMDKEPGVYIDTEIESLEEIDKIMRVPSKQKSPLK